MKQNTVDSKIILEKIITNWSFIQIIKSSRYFLLRLLSCSLYW